MDCRRHSDWARAWNVLPACCMKGLPEKVGENVTLGVPAERLVIILLILAVTTVININMSAA